MERNDAIRTIESIFRLRKDKRYRDGFLQAAVSFGAITNTECKVLEHRFVIDNFDYSKL